MDLTSDHPYWTLTNGLPAHYPSLRENVECDVAVLGCGISGALAAEALTADGHHVVMLDSRDVCHGSTSASTALLQYEIDTHLIDLMERHGPERARNAYQACHDSIDQIESLIRRLRLGDCGFLRKESVYLACEKRDLEVLRKECAARSAMGIDVELWEAADVSRHLGIDRPGAIRSTQAAEVDPYRLAHALLKVIVARGARIHDRTAVVSVTSTPAGVKLVTDRGFMVHAKKLIVASGYESGELFKTGHLVNLNSSYAIASEPLEDTAHWWRRCLIWETARPYFYLRTDSDGRAILGGFDDKFRNPKARDRRISGKAKKLEKKFESMFPDIPLEVAYAWAGTFGETADGLAYIGAYQPHPHCLFALGYGGNGITFSMVAAEILRCAVRQEMHPYADTFRFERDSR